MHEMSIVASLLDIVKAELAAHGATKLLVVRVKHGRLANVAPEAMEFAFTAMTMDTEFAGARIEMEEIPLTLACGVCKAEFSPEDKDIFMPCPQCGEQLGHAILAGKELFLDHLEAE